MVRPRHRCFFDFLGDVEVLSALGEWKLGEAKEGFPVKYISSENIKALQVI